jgi:hypothetical protein
VLSDHGAWALWLGPLAVGVGVGGWHGVPTLCLVAAWAAAFLSRHPLTLLAKTIAGRHSRDDAAPAVAWPRRLGLEQTAATAVSSILLIAAYRL